jgi:hypothetical protein
VAWDVMCGDYNSDVSARLCLEKIKRRAVPGSIVVFHDSEKAAGKYPYLLEQTLQYFGQKGYTFEKMAESESDTK